MIRKTVARAFAHSDDLEEPAPNAVSATELGQTRRMQEVFEALPQFLMRPATLVDATSGRSTDVTVSEMSPSQLGVEFLVSAPDVQCRVVNSLKGMLFVNVLEKSADAQRGGGDGKVLSSTVLSLYADEVGTPQLIEKVVSQGRSPFLYTSVPAVAQRILSTVISRPS